MLSSIKGFFNSSNYNRVYTLFILKLLAIYFLWEFIARSFVYPMSFNVELNHHLASASAFILRLFGFNAVGKNAMVLFNGEISVGIGTACNGISFIGVIAGLTFGTPTTLKNKLLFFPLITLAIYLTNVIRIALLAYTWKFNHLSFEFNHKFLYLYSIYAIIFVIWYLWFQRVSLKREKL